MLNRIFATILIAGQAMGSASASDSQYLYRTTNTGVIAITPSTGTPPVVPPEPVVPDFIIGDIVTPEGYKRGTFTLDLAKAINPASLKHVGLGDIDWTWSIDPDRSPSSSAALPQGLGLVGSTISGTFLTSGRFDVVVTASAKDIRRSKRISILSKLPETGLELASASLPAASIAEPYEYDLAPLLTTTGIAKADVKWNVVSAVVSSGEIDGLPDGVKLTSEGKLKGTPVGAGTFVFAVAAAWSDDNPQAETVASVKTFSITSSGAAELAKIDIGDYHSCAVTAVGGVKCWGQNQSGQLGNGSGVNSSVPVDVSGLTTGVKAIAVGSYHTCAITKAGAVKCWGNNSSGQLGNNSLANSNVPVDVSGISSGAEYITAADGNGSSGHTCVIIRGGSVKCWGMNNYGQLGNNSTARSLVPVDVQGVGGGVSLIAAGSMHTCGVLFDGTARCWGRGDSGQLGNGISANSLVPVKVSGLSGIVTLKAGGDNTTRIATCAVTGAGGIKCWGSNSDGQLGNNSTANSNVPIDVEGMTSGVVNVALGNRHACGTLSSGAVKCWGWNSNGQLGNGTSAGSRIPVAVSGFASGSTAIAAGYQHSCAITATGSVRCWGQNAAGQLGNNTTTQSTTSVAVSGT